MAEVIWPSGDLGLGLGLCDGGKAARRALCSGSIAANVAPLSAGAIRANAAAHCSDGILPSNTARSSQVRVSVTVSVSIRVRARLGLGLEIALERVL